MLEHFAGLEPDIFGIDLDEVARVSGQIFRWFAGCIWPIPWTPPDFVDPLRLVQQPSPSKVGQNPTGHGGTDLYAFACQYYRNLVSAPFWILFSRCPNSFDLLNRPGPPPNAMRPV